MGDDQRDVYEYPGEAVDVTWDRRLCIHVQECTRAKEGVFARGRDPWGQPDLAPADAVAEIAERCPTGALVAHRKDGGPAEAPPAENTVVVSSRGPVYLHGDLRIAGAPDDMPGVRTRAALCRCGDSRNKPFCDNTHEAEGFSEHGAIGDAGPGPEGTGGPLEVDPRPNGPVLLRGDMTIISGSGRATWRGSKAAICRCGQSANKPFCDGTHASIGFTTEDA